MSVPVLEVQGLAYAYPDGHQALFGVDLHVHRGERVALLGPNGAGKTTLVLHLNGILVAGAGSVTVSGLPVAKEHLREIRRRVGVVFQEDRLLPWMTLRDNVGLVLKPLGVAGRERRAIADRYLAQAGLRGFEDYYPAEISGGMCKRAGLARALALDPDVLFFDEPSAGLDPISSRNLDELILQLRDSLGATFVVVSHELSSIFTIAWGRWSSRVVATSITPGSATAARRRCSNAGLRGTQ